MPSIITHKLFAEEVLEGLQKYDIKKIIKKYPQIFYIGSSGPDFLFFSNALPWEFYKSHALNRLGSKMHSTHINDFYQVAIDCVKKQTKKGIKEEMMAFLFGHLCHWALDVAAHPYVFYRTGDCKGESAGLHHRFESTIDTIMLQIRKKADIKAYPFYEICESNDDSLRAISRIYVPVARKVYHMDVNVHDIRVTLNSWYEIQKLLYDPNSVKYPILKGVEALIRKPWAVSGNVIRTKIDDPYDVMNNSHCMWKHPCDEALISTKSFLDLYYEAIPIAIAVIEKAYGSIEYGSNIHSVLGIIGDKAYNTGMQPGCEMKYFENIYKG